MTLCLVKPISPCFAAPCDLSTSTLRDNKIQRNPMKLIARLVLCASLLVAFSAPAHSQKKKKTACPVPPPSPFKHTGQIATSFDKSANGMRTTLEHPRAFNAAGAAIYLSASFTHQDPRRPAAPSLELTFISVSPAQKFREAHDLVLLCDGAQRSFAEPLAHHRIAGGRQQAAGSKNRSQKSEEAWEVKSQASSFFCLDCLLPAACCPLPAVIACSRAGSALRRLRGL